MATQDTDSRHPLLEAVASGDAEAVARLLARPARAASVTPAVLLEALGAAARRGETDLVRTLLDAGAPAQDEAIRGALAARDTDSLELLLARGAPADLDLIDHALETAGSDATIRMLEAWSQAPAIAHNLDHINGFAELMNVPEVQDYISALRRRSALKAALPRTTDDSDTGSGDDPCHL